MNIQDKLIKALHTSRYSIELFETASNLYIIRYENPKNGVYRDSEAMKDFKMASWMFDVKVEELDGN
jgi:hypothetical protein